MAKEWWSAKRKKDVARRMITSGHTNEQVMNHLKEKSGSGISTADLAVIRRTVAEAEVEAAETPKKKKNGKISKEDVLVLQGQELSPDLRILLGKVRSEMLAEGIQIINVDHNGNINIRQMQDLVFKV